jgi:hypothetical protein
MDTLYNILVMYVKMILIELQTFDHRSEVTCALWITVFPLHELFTYPRIWSEVSYNAHLR